MVTEGGVYPRFRKWHKLDYNAYDEVVERARALSRFEFDDNAAAIAWINWAIEDDTLRSVILTRNDTLSHEWSSIIDLWDVLHAQRCGVAENEDIV